MGDSCEVCKGSMPDGSRSTQKYCSSTCYAESRRASDRARRKYRRNESLVLDEWYRRHPGIAFTPGWPHYFDEDMKCAHCGASWSSNQDLPRPRCTNPDAYEEIRLNREGRPKVLRYDSANLLKKQEEVS